jgi:hypothetical protein
VKRSRTYWRERLARAVIEYIQLTDMVETLELRKRCLSGPSETFKRTHYFQVAKKLLTGVEPSVLSTIKDEIEAGVKRAGVKRKRCLSGPPATLAEVTRGLSEPLEASWWNHGSLYRTRNP